MSQAPNQLDRKDLKIQALLEKLGSQASNYENQIADLRVELTLLEQNVNEQKSLSDTLSQQLDDIQVRESQPKAVDPEYVHGEVLSNVPSSEVN